MATDDERGVEEEGMGTEKSGGLRRTTILATTNEDPES